jgi:hypothetical protein
MPRQRIFLTVEIAHPHVAARAQDSGWMVNCLNLVFLADQQIQNLTIAVSSFVMQTAVLVV